jgi:hypothetical protein
MDFSSEKKPQFLYINVFFNDFKVAVLVDSGSSINIIPLHLKQCGPTKFLRSVLTWSEFVDRSGLLCIFMSDIIAVINWTCSFNSAISDFSDAEADEEFSDLFSFLAVTVCPYCFKCKGRGHYQRECNWDGTGEFMSRAKCQLCFQEGHTANVCSIKCGPCDLIFNSICATPETLIVSLLANLISEHSSIINNVLNPCTSSLNHSCYAHIEVCDNTVTHIQWNPPNFLHISLIFRYIINKVLDFHPKTSMNPTTRYTV